MGHDTQFSARRTSLNVAWAARPCSAAFTLIELMAALAILAILSIAAAFAFSAPLARARTTDAISSLKSFDTNTRQYAVRFDRQVDLIIDLDNNQLRRNPSAHTLSFSSSIRILEVRLPARRHTSGQVNIPCTPAGLTPTYALHLTGPQTNRWILVAGLTGQITETHDEQSLNNLLATLSPQAQRRDAD